MSHALKIGAIKGFQFGFGFSVIGHIVLLLAGQSGLVDVVFSTFVTGLLLWGPLGALIGAGAGLTWRLLHPAPRRPTTLPE